MAQGQVRKAIVLLVLGNLLAMFSDIVIKLQGEETPILQFVFLRLLCALLLLLPFLGFIDRRVLWRGTGIYLLRAHISLVGVGCMVLALVTLPLATANAVFYAAPLIILALAAIFFREKTSWLSIIAVGSGFVGILLALRPTEVGWQSLSALGAAFALSLNALLVRKLPTEHTTVHALLLTQLYALRPDFY
ncbi:EamA family transporter [Alkalilimnicola ehrlichii]|uniref:EamA family transporter n=1 Tax=Alkalilimnicola ehrlichii TaxID=351052 RepID=UPI001C6E3A9E|nr:EamA family transporter [Alkalilimnicola ehrlichii]